MNFFKNIGSLINVKNEESEGKSTVQVVANTKIGLKWKLIILGSVFAFFIVFVAIVAALIQMGILDIGDLTTDSSYLTGIYQNCDSLIVDGVAYTLDDYVAGVVASEAYLDQSMEALKAQAIAARTYAIVNTGNCSTAIGSTDAQQVFNETTDERAIQAATETSGMVLTYNGKLFSAMYDSYCYEDSDCPDSQCSNGECTVTYTKLPAGEEHIITVPDTWKSMFVSGGGHAKGMSQIASYVLANNGYTYDSILKYFYSAGVEIGNMITASNYGTGTLAADANGFIKRVGQPESGNKYYFSDYNLSYATGYVGQCTWYVYGRANETLALAGSDLQWTFAPHAKYWYSVNLSQGTSGFKSTTNVLLPKVGAIIVWSSNDFGHVAFIEAVNDDGTIDYSEANISSAKSSTNPYGWRYVSNVSYTDTGLGSINQIWLGYHFVGYIYMLD